MGEVKERKKKVTDKTVDAMMSIIQHATDILFMKGLDALAVHNVLEISYSRALDKYWVEP